MSVKDTKLNEKEQFVVKGDILADSFRNRVNGKELAALDPGTLEELEKLLTNPTIKTGQYILDENANFILVDDVPEDYSGIGLFIGDDGYMDVESYESGNRENFVEISDQNISISIGNEEVSLTINGVTKLNFASLTHSFNELDETLKALVISAIDDGGQSGVACTEPQWNAIKSLLDKSLYINYSGISMIKASTDGISQYVFGLRYADAGSQLMLNYTDGLLFALYDVA